MRNYRIYIHFKKKKSKVKRFVDETGETLVAPDVSVIQEPTEILDPSQCLDFEALLNYLPAWTEWLIKNDINSFPKYRGWFLRNEARQETYKKRGQPVNYIPVDDIVPGICFKIVDVKTIQNAVQKNPVLAAIKDCIVPLVSVRLTKELTYRFLDNLKKEYSFNNKNDLKKIISNSSNFSQVLFQPNIEQKSIRKLGVNVDGVIYPFPSDLQIRDTTLPYDRAVIQFIDDWFSERLNVTKFSSETAKYIFDENDKTIITDIFTNIISELISNNYRPTRDGLEEFIKNILPKTSLLGKKLQSYFEYKGVNYIIPVFKNLPQPIKDEIKNLLSLEKAKLDVTEIGGSIIIQRGLHTLKETFPDYEFITEAKLKLYFGQQYLPWLENKFRVDINKGQINTELACNFISQGYRNLNFKLSNIENLTDDFTLVKKEENKFDLLIKSIRPNHVKRFLDIETTNIWPVEYRVDLLVLKDNRPIIAYEYDGETHYDPIHDNKEKLLRQFVSDQIENAFFDDIRFPYKRIPRVKNSGIQFGEIIPFIINDLNNLIYS